MTYTIDQLLDRITALSTKIEDPATGGAERKHLETERERLRSEARDLADQRRHPASIQAEINMLEERLEEIDGFQITKGHSEKYLHRTIQDPSAYSANINSALADQHKSETEEIRKRLRRLRSLHEQAAAVDTPDGNSLEEG